MESHLQPPKVSMMHWRFHPTFISTMHWRLNLQDALAARTYSFALTHLRFHGAENLHGTEKNSRQIQLAAVER
jgi:hypothetical protein